MYVSTLSISFFLTAFVSSVVHKVVATELSGSILIIVFNLTFVQKLVIICKLIAHKSITFILTEFDRREAAYFAIIVCCTFLLLLSAVFTESQSYTGILLTFVYLVMVPHFIFQVAFSLVMFLPKFHLNVNVLGLLTVFTMGGYYHEKLMHQKTTDFVHYHFESCLCGLLLLDCIISEAYAREKGWLCAGDGDDLASAGGCSCSWGFGEVKIDKTISYQGSRFATVNLPEGHSDDQQLHRFFKQMENIREGEAGQDFQPSNVSINAKNDLSTLGQHSPNQTRRDTLVVVENPGVDLEEAVSESNFISSTQRNSDSNLGFDCSDTTAAHANKASDSSENNVLRGGSRFEMQQWSQRTMDALAPKNQQKEKKKKLMKSTLSRAFLRSLKLFETEKKVEVIKEDGREDSRDSLFSVGDDKDKGGLFELFTRGSSFNLSMSGLNPFKTTTTTIPEQPTTSR